MGKYTKQKFLKRRNSDGQKTHEKMLTHMIKSRAHKGGERIGKTPKKLASICCP
jgi:hypothetical protein